MVKEGTLTADGNTDEVFSSGRYTIHLSGTFGGGVFQLQFMDTQGAWRNYDPSLYGYSQNADQTILEVQNVTVRGVLSGSSSPSLFWRFGV